MAVKRTGQPSFIEALLPQGWCATGEGGQLSRLDAVRKIPMTRKTPAINLLPTTKYPPCHFSKSKSNNATGTLWERSYRIHRCDTGEGLSSIVRPEPITPTLSHKGEREPTSAAEI